MSRRSHIKLTSHPGGAPHLPICWGAADPKLRGPLIGSTSAAEHRNVIGTHSGSYAVYRALAVAAGALDPAQRPDLTNTAPTDRDRAAPAVGRSRADRLARSVRRGGGRGVTPSTWTQGYDIRPTIAITKAHIDVPEIGRCDRGRAACRPTARSCATPARRVVTKAAIEPVWYLPGVAERFGCTEAELRRTLFEQTGGMFPELVTRGDLEVFLPPIGGQTVYMFGDIAQLADPDRAADRARARRVQRLGRVRLRHLHLPAVPGPRDRGVHPRRAGRRRGRHRLLPQGGARARRGDEVPRLQRAQAPGGRRSRPTSTSPAPSASPACRTCASRS